MVVLSAPFHRTFDVAMKLLPVTVRVKAAPPAVAELGEIVVRVGTGLFAALMVKLLPAETPPPGAGLKTVTEAVPAEAMSAAEIAAFSWVEEIYVVVRATAFHRTEELGIKPVPVTMRVNAGPPAVAELGERVVMVGTGLVAGLMVKVRAPDVPPPGVGLKTVTLAVPAVAMSVAGMAAVSCVDEIYVVVRSVPFHWTVEVGMKLEPVTVRVKAVPPAAAELG